MTSPVPLTTTSPLIPPRLTGVGCDVRRASRSSGQPVAEQEDAAFRFYLPMARTLATPRER